MGGSAGGTPLDGGLLLVSASLADPARACNFRLGGKGHFEAAPAVAPEARAPAASWDAVARK